MEKVKKFAYFLIIMIFIMTTIPYVLEFAYFIGDEIFKIELLPEPIWEFLDIYFYYEALPFRIIQMFVIYVILSILLLIFYRKIVSKATIILSTITPIIFAFGSTSPYWVYEVTDKGDIAFIVISVVGIVHIVATNVLLIRDREEFEYV